MPADTVLASGQSYRSIGRTTTAIAFEHPDHSRWWLAFLAALGLLGVFAVSLCWLLYEGTGIWGNNIPVTWALDIVSYDWWIGIASGGLLTSAALLLLGSAWRGALNRITETMALLAAAAAGLYPIIHLGRPWFFYWNLPYPNTFLLWPQWRSPLVWDAVDILSYLLICLCFWYVGMLPDLASLRDRAVARSQAAGRLTEAGRKHGERHLFKAHLYGIAALGWRGSAVHWHRWTLVYRLIALFGAIVVVSLQTGAAVMFAGSLEPGWHDTLMPVAFLAAALFQGLAVISVLAVLLRALYPLRAFITKRHFDVLSQLLLALGLFNLYCYAAEFLTSAELGTAYDGAVLARRFNGANSWSSWMIIGCALAPVQLFWLPVLRRSGLVLGCVGLAVAAGLWADHFMIIVITLQHDFLPSAAHRYTIDFWGMATFAGSFGLFLMLLLLAIRFLPLVSIHELRRLAGPGAEKAHV